MTQQTRLEWMMRSPPPVRFYAPLHFGFAARLARLSQAVRDFGEGRADRVEAVSGGDDVQELSAAFATMAARLGEREAEGLADALVSGDGIGHRVMRRRALLIGGTFEIGSSPAGGTRMACNIPSSR
jgi:hypothetical protein